MGTRLERRVVGPDRAKPPKGSRETESIVIDLPYDSVTLGIYIVT